MLARLATLLSQVCHYEKVRPWERSALPCQSSRGQGMRRWLIWDPLATWATAIAPKFQQSLYWHQESQCKPLESSSISSTAAQSTVGLPAKIRKFPSHPFKERSYKHTMWPTSSKNRVPFKKRHWQQAVGRPAYVGHMAFSVSHKLAC